VPQSIDRQHARHLRSGRMLIQVGIIIGLGFVIGVADAFVLRPITLGRDAPPALDLTPNAQAGSDKPPAQPGNRRTPQTTAVVPPVEEPMKIADPVGTPPVATPAAAASTADAAFKFTPKDTLKAGHLTVDEAKVLYDNGSPFIDARKLEVFVAGHVLNAMRLDMASFRNGNPPELGLIDRSATVVVYCGGGQCDESEHVAEFMDGSGYKKVYIMHDGYPGWVAAGHPTAMGE